MDMEEFRDPSPYLAGQCGLLEGAGLGMTNCDGLKGRRTNVLDRQLPSNVISTGGRNLIHRRPLPDGVVFHAGTHGGGWHNR